MRLFYGVLLLLVFAGAGYAQGIAGRAAQGGDLVRGVEVRAYQVKTGTFGPMNGGKAAARVTAGDDGKYKLNLPPGRYVVEALRKKPGNTAPTPEPGDLYCLYSGSPVTVAKDKWTGVGLNIAEVRPQAEAPAEFSSIRGSLTFKGRPVEKAYLYLYTSVDGDFRGPADILQPVGNGAFKVRVAPGKYYLVARKRLKGGSNGPIETGDLFNFYPLNPVIVTQGREITLEVPLVERLSALEEIEGAYKGVKVLVTDAGGKPLAGHYVLAYVSAARSGHPEATAGPTGADGIVYLNAPPGAKYLRIRPVVGGPPDPDEKNADATLSGVGSELKVKILRK